MKRLVLLWSMCLISLLNSSCGSEEDEKVHDATDDVHSIETYRAQKDQYFKTNDSSPIPSEMRSAFKGLRYFPYNDDYAVLASFAAAETSDTLRMLSSKGDTQTMIRAGVFSFSIGGGDKVYTLTGYRSVGQDSKSIIVPFMDRTTDRETYTAGRYLEVDDTGEECLLDFNMAYNPYCAYNDNFSCLRVPPNNVLTVAIKAGEKSPQLAASGH